MSEHGEVYRLDEMTLGMAYDLCAHDQAERALLGLMERIELAASEDRFEDISALLTRTIVDRLDPSVLVGMLSIAKHGRDRLTSWQGFLARVEDHLVRTLGPLRAETILRLRRG